jgi:hypothetical protein
LLALSNNGIFDEINGIIHQLTPMTMKVVHLTNIPDDVINAVVEKRAELKSKNRNLRFSTPNTIYSMIREYVRLKKTQGVVKPGV